MAAPLDATQFRDQAARAKSVLDAPFLTALAVYPLAVGATLAGRTGIMSVVSDRPPTVVPGSPPGATPSGPDLWLTADTLSLATTGISFTAVTLPHLYLVGHLAMKRIPGAPEMSRLFNCFAPLILLVFTLTYFLTYLGLSGYGVSMGEWIIFCFFCVAVFFFSVCLVTVPFNQQAVFKLSPEQEGG